MTTIIHKLNPLPEAAPTHTTVQRIAASLTPYKLRSKHNDRQIVIIKVPVRFGGEYTYLYLDHNDMTWGSGSEPGTKYINDNYEFVGPLLPGESVTIAG